MRGSHVWVCALPLALLAGGCTHTQVSPPQATVAVPAGWAESDPAPISEDITQYWHLLNDPLLIELVEKAVTNNRDLAQSAGRLDLARSQLRGARAGYMPTITGSGSVKALRRAFFTFVDNKLGYYRAGDNADIEIRAVTADDKPVKTAGKLEIHRVTFTELTSPYGHDSFLLEVRPLAQLLQPFLEQTRLAFQGRFE